MTNAKQRIRAAQERLQAIQAPPDIPLLIIEKCGSRGEKPGISERRVLKPGVAVWENVTDAELMQMIEACHDGHY